MSYTHALVVALAAWLAWWSMGWVMNVRPWRHGRRK